MSVFRAGLFAQKTAIVTGGGTGIGRAIARELLSLGCNVVIASRKLEVLQAAQKELQEHSNSRCEVFQCNIREEQEVAQLFDFTTSQFSMVDILVNNGGGQFPSNVESITAKGWRSVVDLNLTGTFLCSKQAYLTGGMREHGGSICNIVCETHSGFPGMAHTGAARDGVINMTKTMAVEWARSNVRVNCVAPGIIYNESAQQHYAKQANDANYLDQFAPNIPARRIGTVEEVSAAVTFLCSPAAAYITGISLDVGGGSHLSPSTFTTKFEYGAWPRFEGM